MFNTPCQFGQFSMVKYILGSCMHCLPPGFTFGMFVGREVLYLLDGHDLFCSLFLCHPLLRYTCIQLYMFPARIAPYVDETASIPRSKLCGLGLSYRCHIVLCGEYRLAAIDRYVYGSTCYLQFPDLLEPMAYKIIYSQGFF